MEGLLRADVVVIGAGAAGLFCAIEAGRRGRRVVVLEHAASVGKKIAISGGGRCNFTNVNTTHENFISANPNFARSALARYTPADFVALVERHRIPYHEKKLGQLFCDESARRIIDMLLDEARAAGVEIRLNCKVSRVGREGGGRSDEGGAGESRALGGGENESGRGAPFLVETNQGALACASLVVATGGLSIPKIGATDFGYRLARRFGLGIQTPRPALVPLTLAAADLSAFRPLSGVSVPAVVRCGPARFAENILITHRGLSGPAVLQISSYWTPGRHLDIDLLPDADIERELASARNANLELSTLLARHLPRRFAQTWCDLHARSRPLRQYPPRELQDIARALRDWRVTPSGTEGFHKAEVTLGGVDTDELSSKTMEARRVPGLYFVGEVVDVTGHLGGYNFQWAWSSGYAAGQYV